MYFMKLENQEDRKKWMKALVGLRKVSLSETKHMVFEQ
jgi:hypothetical protein